MLAVKARLTVEADGTARLRLPGTVPAGEREVVVVLDENEPAAAVPPRRSILDGFPTDDFGAEGLPVSREDMYGDDGR
jgi:hypothetical protein